MAPDGHLVFPIGMIFAVFYLRHPDASYQFRQLAFVFEKKRKIDFQDGRHGGHLELRIGTILGILDLLATPMLPTE